MQTSYSQDPAIGYAGQIVNSRPTDIISRRNATKQLEQLTFGTTDGTYTVTINGTLAASYAASSKTATQIRDAVLALLQASSAPVVSSALSTDKLLVEGADSDTSFTISISTVTTYALAHLLDQGQTIPFGVGVVRDERASATGKQCRLPRVTGDIAAGVFLGIAIADQTLEGPTPPASAVGYKNHATLEILQQGEIFVVTEGAVTEGAQLYCRFASGSGGSQLGAFRADADSSTATAVPGLYATETTSAAGIAKAQFKP